MTKGQLNTFVQSIFLIVAGIGMCIWQYNDQKNYDELYNTGAHFQATIVDNYTTVLFKTVPIAEFTIQDLQKHVELAFANNLKVGDSLEIVYNPTTDLKAMPANAERSWQLYVVGAILLIIGLLGLYSLLQDRVSANKQIKV
jgi:hypothetical protein